MIFPKYITFLLCIFFLLPSSVTGQQQMKVVDLDTLLRYNTVHSIFEYYHHQYQSVISSYRQYSYQDYLETILSKDSLNDIEHQYLHYVNSSCKHQNNQRSNLQAQFEHIILTNYYTYLKRCFEQYQQQHPVTHIFSKEYLLYYPSDQEITTQMVTFIQQTPFELSTASQIKLNKILKQAGNNPNPILTFPKFKQQQQWKNIINSLSKMPYSAYSSYQQFGILATDKLIQKYLPLIVIL